MKRKELCCRCGIELDPEEDTICFDCEGSICEWSITKQYKNKTQYTSGCGGVKIEIYDDTLFIELFEGVNCSCCGKTIENGY